MAYCPVEVSASQSSNKCSMSSVVFALHISQFVYPSVCILSMLSFRVPVLALNKVVVAAELSYKSCSSCKHVCTLYKVLMSSSFVYPHAIIKFHHNFLM